MRTGAEARTGLTIERVFSTRRRAPVRRAHLGAPRRRPDPTGSRRDRLRAARRGVPPLLVRQRLHDRHHQVLPRRPSAPTVREWSLKQLIDRVVSTYVKAGRDHGYFATAGRRRDFRARADLAAGPPGTSRSTPRSGSTSVPRRRSRSAPASSSGRRLDGLDPQLVQGGGLHLQGRLRRRPQPLPHPLVQGAALLRRYGVRPGRFMRGADASAGTIKSGGATRRAAKMVVLDVDHPDIVEFVETKAREEDKIRALRDAGFDMDLGGDDITSVQYQNANNSVRVSDEFMRAVEDGTSSGCAPARPARSSRPSTPASCSPRSPRRRGSAPTRPAVRRHDQRLAHQPRDRPDHRVQPVLGVHVARQLLVQPRVPQPAEVPHGRRHLRRALFAEGRRADHHRDGHLDLLRRLPDRGDRRDHPRLPPARHRLRQPRCAADGDGSGLRLRRRSGDGRDRSRR